jgi:hypothetical protein
VVRLHRRHFTLRLAFDSALCRGFFRSRLGRVLMLRLVLSLVLSEDWIDGEETAAEREAKQTIQKDDPPMH